MLRARVLLLERQMASPSQDRRTAKGVSHRGGTIHRWGGSVWSRTPILAGVLIVAGVMLGAVCVGTSRNRAVYLLPHEGRTEYQINVFTNERSLTAREVARRYRVPFRGATALTPAGLQAVVREVESRRPTEEAFVRLHTKRHGEMEQVWLWPQR